MATIEQEVNNILIDEIVWLHELEISSGSTLSDLGADSLDVIEITMRLEEDFGISIDDSTFSGKTTVQEIYDYIRHYT